MVIRQTNDSWAKCDPNSYGGLYDISKPKVKAALESVQPSIHRDTLEINAAKLKKEALERLRHDSKYLIFQNSFVRIGKYLFVTVAFLPYLFVYGIPKWVLTVATPKLFIMIANVYDHAQSKAQSFAKKVAQQIVRFSKYMQDMAAIIIQPLMKSLRSLQAGINKFRHQVHSFSVKIFKKAKRFITLPKIFKKKNDQDGGMKNAIEEWIKQKTNQVSNHLHQILVNVKEYPQTFLAKLQNKSAQLQENLLSFPEMWKANLKTAIQLTNNVSEWFANITSQAKRWVNQFTQPLKIVAKEFIRPNYFILKGWLKNYLKNLGENLDRRKKTFVGFLLMAQGKLRAYSYQNFYETLFSFILSLGLPAFRIQKFLDQKFIQVTLRLCFKFFTYISIVLLKAIEYLTNAVGALFQYASKSIRVLSDYVNKGWTWLLAYLKAGWNGLYRLFQKFLYMMLLFSIMIAITLFWGFRSGKRMLDVVLKLGH